MFLTAGAIMSLKAELPPGSEIFIIDNGSDEETLATIRADIDQPGSGIRFLVNDEPRAYAKSINMAAAAPGDYDALLVSNNDVIYAPGSIEAMIEGLSGLHELVIPLSPRDVAKAGVSAPRIGRPLSLENVYQNYEAVCHWWKKSAASFTGYAPVPHPYIAQGGYSFLITRRLWDQLGGMDEEYKLFGEDYDLFSRAVRWTKMIQSRGAYVEHLEHQTVAWLGLERDIRMCKSRFKLTEKRDGIKELVSVIIPTFNRTDALFEAIDSVFRQSMPHFRIYVVDDGSKDWDRIQKASKTRYRGREDRIWFFHLAENGGPAAARNFGMDVCSGKYVAFLDSDDIWHPNHLDAHLLIHETNPGAVMTYSKTDFAWRWFDEESRRFRYRPDRHPETQLSDQTFSVERLDRENFIKTSSVMVWGGLLRRDDSFSDPIRFPVEDDHRMAAEDWQFFKAVAARGPVDFLPKVTARTHWSKLVDSDEHHSARIIPWANYGDPNPDWLAREVSLPEASESKISIVTPTRGRPAEIRRLIDMIPASMPIIVVADGIPTGKDLASLTQEKPNMGLLVVDQPKGPSFARNRGVEAAKTEWVWFMDDDDLPMIENMAWAEPYLENSDVIIGGMIVGLSETELRVATGLYTSALLVRCEVFQRAGGFDEGSRWAEERELLGRLEAAGARISKVDRPIVIKTAGSVKANSLVSSNPVGKRDPR